MWITVIKTLPFWHVLMTFPVHVCVLLRKHSKAHACTRPTHAHTNTLDLVADNRVAFLFCFFCHWLGPLRAKVQLSLMLHGNKETQQITEWQPGTQWMAAVCLWEGGVGGLQWEGGRRWEKRRAGCGEGSGGLYLDFPFGTKLLPLLSKWDINSFVCRRWQTFRGVCSAQC